MIITGGAGFIGGHLAKRLPEATIWDRKKPQSYGNLMFQWQDKETMIHLAASTYLTEGYDKQIIEDNISLVNEIKRLSDDERLIYASSAAVYNLNNLYAYSKKYAEDLFSDCNATGLRYYNVYGPNDNGVVGKLIDCALNNKVFVMNGGEQIRDYIYIDDVIEETIKAIDSKEKIIEIGTGQGTRLIDLLIMVQDLTGNLIKVDRRTQSAFETKESICPQPINNPITLEEGLKRTIEWHKNK
jgi:UDP-glucose 4-epimerase